MTIVIVIIIIIIIIITIIIIIIIIIRVLHLPRRPVQPDGEAVGHVPPQLQQLLIISTPNLPAKNLPAKIARLTLYGEWPYEHRYIQSLTGLTRPFDIAQE